MTVNEQASGLDTSGDGYIRLDGITKTFDDGTVVAVEDVDLDIDRDEFIVLLGPSGCGKTTTLRCIAGLETPNSGRILIGDEDVTDTKPKGRDLAFVFQSIALFPHMTVRENMRFGLDMKTDLSAEEKEERIQRAADILGIPELLDRKPGALSGGQQQRVSLGRAMVIEPEAFLLDEPFSALDANLRDQMRVEVKKLQRELETSMIFVTHDQEEAMTLGDRIVVMNDARIMQIGSPNDIYNEPANLFVAEFIGSPSTNTIEGEVSREGDDLVVSTDLFSFPLSAEQARRYTGEERQEVVLGVRPEYLRIGTGEALFSATLDVIENHGARDAVFLSEDGHELTAVTDQGVVDAAHGETVDVSAQTGEVWLFAPDGSRLL
ncbi:MAG: ABC transporter ATP-binding protein [Haloarculaceae archaeon]